MVLMYFLKGWLLVPPLLLCRAAARKLRRYGQVRL